MNSTLCRSRSTLAALAVCFLLFQAAGPHRPCVGADARVERDSRLQYVEDSHFTPPDERLLEEASTQLKAAIRRLRQQRGQQDRDQLEWLGIPESADAPLQSMLDDLQSLRQIQSQLEQDFEPFEQPVYQDLYSAIDRYRRVVQAREESDLEAQFEQRRAALRSLISSIDGQPDTKQHRQLARHVAWLEQHVQSPDLVQHLRDDFSYPNVVLRLPQDSLILVSEQSIERSEPVRQESGPVQTTGTSYLQGTVRLIPQDGATPLRLTFPGTMQLMASNRMGPYRFASRATTRLDAGMDLELSREGLRAASLPTASACTSLRNGQARATRHGPVSKVGGRLIDRLVARQSKKAAGQISKTVAQRIREELGRMAEQQLVEINKQFKQTLLDRATRMQMQPRLWDVAGTRDYLTIRLTVDQQSGLGAAGPLPESREFDAPAISMHESFVTDLANAAFRGQNFPTELDANALQSFNDQMPFKLFEQREFLPETHLHVFLHPRRPLRIRFTNGRVEMQLRASRMELDDESLEDCRLTIQFDLHPKGKTIVIRRDGEPRIWVAPDREVAEATIYKFEQAVRGELLAAMKREVEIPSVVETEQWNVQPDRLESSNGWLTVVGQFAKRTKKTPAVDSAALSAEQ